MAAQAEALSTVATSEQPAAGVLCRYVREAVQARLDTLHGLPDDAPFSLSITLPDSLLAGAPLAGEVQWFVPQGAFSLRALGAVQRQASIAEYRQLRARWRALEAAAPLSFFSLGAATDSVQRLDLWQPEILLRRDAQGDTLTLCALRAGRSAAAVLDRWLALLPGLFEADPAPSAHSFQAASAPLIETAQTRPPAADWLAQVRATRAAIAAGRLDKAVLARRLQVQLAQPVALFALLARLRQDYPDCHVFSLPHARGQVVAATPELLARRRGGELLSCAIAGTLKQGEGDRAGAQAIAAFLASPKERREHALVVEDIRRRMQPLCANVEHDAVPALLPLRFVQHLCTRVRGRLHPGHDVLDAALALHPTPAVLGAPLESARAWLAALGERRDGLYTGVAGWLDAQGDGEAVVVLRAAYLEGTKAVLWAGAGIMADSDPDAELAETELKLQTMLEALG